jgi:hypothetical protein
MPSGGTASRPSRAGDGGSPRSSSLGCGLRSRSRRAGSIHRPNGDPHTSRRPLAYVAAYRAATAASHSVPPGGAVRFPGPPAGFLRVQRRGSSSCGASATPPARTPLTPTSRSTARLTTDGTPSGSAFAETKLPTGDGPVHLLDHEGDALGMILIAMPAPNTIRSQAPTSVGRPAERHGGGLGPREEVVTMSDIRC